MARLIEPKKLPHAVPQEAVTLRECVTRAGSDAIHDALRNEKAVEWRWGEHLMRVQVVALAHSKLAPFLAVEVE
jgi:hypothetical protein